MEWNKNESIRSRRIAEERMAVGDLAGARRCALTAARLCPEQDGLPLLLALLDVLHVLQENKDDVESKWHKILQVDPKAHMTTVGKQYRRLCLLLHPNKNKLLRTDDAFKLVTQAWKVASLKLGNSAVRNSEHCYVLDQASCRALSVVDGVPDLAITVAETASADILFFWTICPSCETRYEHLTIYENKFLYCSICGKPFIAIECPLPSELKEDSICNPFLAESMGYFGKFQTGNKNAEQGKSRSKVGNQGGGKMVPKHVCGDVLKHPDVERRQVAGETLEHLSQERLHNVTKRAKRSRTGMKDEAARKENQKPRKSPRLMTSGRALAPGKGVLGGNRESEVVGEQMPNAKDVAKGAKEYFKGRKSTGDLLNTSASKTGLQRKKLNSGFDGEISTLSSNGLLTGDSLKWSSKNDGTPARARGKGNHMQTAKKVMERGNGILNSSRVQVNSSRTPLADVNDRGKGPKHLCMQMSAGHGAMIGTIEAPKKSDDRKSLYIVAAEQKCHDSNNQPDKVVENTTFQNNGLDRALISATSYTTKGHCMPLITHVEDVETCNSLEIEHAQAGTYQECRLKTKLVEKLKNCIFQSFNHVDDDSLRDVQVRDVEEIKSSNHESHIVKEKMMTAGEKACCFETIQVKLSITFTYPGKPPSEIIEENLGQQIQPRQLDSAPGVSEDPNFEIAVADTQFFLFDKLRREDCFATGQIWAIYDDDDGMPRYYARISKVLSVQPFKVEMVWLNAELNNGFLCTCGEFKLGKYVISEHVNVFSHVMHWERGFRKKIRIYPQRGDVWALYKGWSTFLKAKERNYEYDIVEVLSDYSETAGITVMPLLKVDGFRTVFQKLGDEAEFFILKQELGRFSHQIPVYRLVGDETSGLLQGYMELDTAATTWIT